jgi:hypothetical protein
MLGVLHPHQYTTQFGMQTFAHGLAGRVIPVKQRRNVSCMTYEQKVGFMLCRKLNEAMQLYAKKKA